MKLHEPWEYEGEELCPCCGVGSVTGRHYKICTDPLLTHYESCARYKYHKDRLCDRCEALEKEDQ